MIPGVGVPFINRLDVEIDRECRAARRACTGVQVDTVVHYGRKKIPAIVRTVLELGDPSGFDGVTCCEQNCDRQYGLAVASPVCSAEVGSGDNHPDRRGLDAGRRHHEPTARLRQIGK